MKLLSVKKLNRIYYRLTVSLKTLTYNREFILRKKSYITFIGIPLYSTKEIYVQPNQDDILGFA